MNWFRFLLVATTAATASAAQRVAEAAGPPAMSPDGKHYWDGSRWVKASRAQRKAFKPPGRAYTPPVAASNSPIYINTPIGPGEAGFSADGQFWWTGQQWVSRDGQLAWTGDRWVEANYE